jgi:hypothetical protein
MKELTLPVICRNALTIVALVKDFVNPSFLGLIERAKAHFCPNMLNSNYLNVPFLLSMLLSKIGLLRSYEWPLAVGYYPAFHHRPRPAQGLRENRHLGVGFTVR